MKIINQDFILDGIDKEILRYLTENARTPILEIARQYGRFWVPRSTNVFANWRMLVSFQGVMSK